MATLTQINSWWQNNIVPTVAQRLATFGSFRLNTDPIPMSAVTGLSDALNAKANTTDISSNRVTLSPGTTSYTFAVGGGYCRILFWGGSTDANIGVGTSEGNNDLFEEGLCPAGGELPFDGNKIFRAATTIYFNGVASDTTIIICKL